MDANGVKSTTPAGHCRLTPLVPLILDCTFLYHFSVLLLFKLHSRECWKNLFFNLKSKHFAQIVVSISCSGL